MHHAMTSKAQVTKFNVQNAYDVIERRKFFIILITNIINSYLTPVILFVIDRIYHRI